MKLNGLLNRSFPSVEVAGALLRKTKPFERAAVDCMLACDTVTSTRGSLGTVVRTRHEVGRQKSPAKISGSLLGSPTRRAYPYTSLLPGRIRQSQQPAGEESPNAVRRLRP
jgi:hypothetical protein